MQSTQSFTPGRTGNFGQFGGSFVPPELQTILDEIAIAYEEIRHDPKFLNELNKLYQTYSGRPTALYEAVNLAKPNGGARIFLKREDLNHTGAHKINHCLGEALLAKKMGKKKLIAETGAGQHGVALATAAALLGLECDIYMGQKDIDKQQPNVIRMQMLGAKVIAATAGLKSLKEAVDLAFCNYLKDPQSQFYAIGSVVGPHPFPLMVRDFQSIVGREAREQILKSAGRLPDAVTACVGGGSNAIGLFSAFLDDREVKIYGVEPAGRSLAQSGEHAATLTLGKPGVLHGFNSYLLQDEKGEPAPVHTIASGLHYPGVGPEHSYLKEQGRVCYESISDVEALEAFKLLTRLEGIIPALESSHAVAYGLKLAKTLPKDSIIIINLSGRGDKDLDYIIENHPEVIDN